MTKITVIFCQSMCVLRAIVSLTTPLCWLFEWNKNYSERKKSWKKNILDCDKSQKSVDNFWIETSWVLIGSRKNDRGNPAEDWGAQRGLQVSGLLFDRSVRFSYSSRPRPLQARRKYRNEAGSQETGYRNLMFDRRIVRGNTYAREDVLPVTAQVTQFISD